MLKTALYILLASHANAKSIDWQTETKSIERQMKVPVGLLQAIVSVESSFRPTAINDVGPGTAIASYGIGQLTKDSLRTCGIPFVERFNGKKGLSCAARLLRGLLLKYEDQEAAVSGYNDGTPCLCANGKWMTPLNKTCPLPYRKPCNKMIEGQWRNQKYVDSVLAHMR